MFGELDHIGYIVRDVDAAVAAAQEAFGLPIARTSALEQYSILATFLGEGTGTLEIFTLADGGRSLQRSARNVSPAGSVSGFAPPGDIHRVRNTGDGVAISMHVYGADISRLGTSVRREYDLPVLP